MDEAHVDPPGPTATVLPFDDVTKTSDTDGEDEVLDLEERVGDDEESRSAISFFEGKGVWPNWRSRADEGWIE